MEVSEETKEKVKEFVDSRKELTYDEVMDHMMRELEVEAGILPRTKQVSELDNNS